ncbi:substrate-binding periplasmic protein [Paraglaciecola chathamensis]|uniref:Polar amino acid ABC transporter n=1 Tax=Paraglaciecola chathamensis TaxID=368405 RepID=A0A8H9IBY1_9ALTE|nr:transporter substrate-binding domain-containing protein [Paraglaciecola oceanifecundans]GGZ73050.1 polar amino acid ABC transporter [Paraglaciecola oceanifecundans]
MNIARPLIQLVSWAILVSSVFLVKALANDSTQNLSIAVGWSKPPYVIALNDTGYEVELARQVFKRMGYSITPVYVPYGRTLSMLKSAKVDAALTLSENTATQTIHLTDSYIQYQNVAISLQSSNFKIKRPNDLAKHSVASFQTATKILGKAYADSIKQVPLYLELPDQRRQVGMLLNGSISVLVMDVNIFNHLHSALEPIESRQLVSIHNIFPPSHYHVGFLNSELKEQFNRALNDFQASQAYEILVKKYHIFQEALSTH